MNRLIVIVCLLLISLTGFPQAKMRRFADAINNPSINVFAPFISFDGSSILFMSDYADEGMLLYYSKRETGGDWKQPVEMPKHLNSKLNFQKGYSLSADGKTVFISSAKSGGVGNYDIWMSELSGSTWGEIKNIFLPINTKGNEACATLTPDEKTIFFMRCEKMDLEKADRCKIFMSRKKASGQWEEPVELPANINTGNSQTPRIAADGETLIFSSNKISPNKGGMDLYVTKLKNGVWSNPLPLDVANTDKDDQYVSVQANGRYVLREAPGKFKTEIVEYLIPDDLRSRGVMKVEGFVKDAAGKPTPAYISVFDQYNNKRIFNAQPEPNGSFFLYLLEGSAYELSIDHEQGTYTYYSKQYDLMHNDVLRNEKINVILKPLAAGDELVLDALRFRPNSIELDHADSELRRLTRLIKNTPLNFEVQVLLSGYVEDSVQTSPDLTEVIVDSTNVVLQRVDSLGQLTTRDSLVVRTRYHNDRTEKEANVIIDKLVAAGVDRSTLTLFVNAKQEDIIENRKTIIKIVARPKR